MGVVLGEVRTQWALASDLWVVDGRATRVCAQHLDNFLGSLCGEVLVVAEHSLWHLNPVSLKDTSNKIIAVKIDKSKYTK